MAHQCRWGHSRRRCLGLCDPRVVIDDGLEERGIHISGLSWALRGVPEVTVHSLRPCCRPAKRLAAMLPNLVTATRSTHRAGRAGRVGSARHRPALGTAARRYITASARRGPLTGRRRGRRRCAPAESRSTPRTHNVPLHPLGCSGPAGVRSWWAVDHSSRSEPPRGRPTLRGRRGHHDGLRRLLDTDQSCPTIIRAWRGRALGVQCSVSLGRESFRHDGGPALASLHNRAASPRSGHTASSLSS